ncbi:putative type III polyketide synthase [Daldinia caldariorum]|uniref:putative type III polyketide synthase n=1 Tax=Daldinia caldariorum TaxID=326644 RepID=UPI0020075C18|nr:putative type III polyketide synthase [Daldinia caldariorum]KAI1472735.1 putative type III polyketide synthase [Daldinia caldariorum]
MASSNSFGEMGLSIIGLGAQYPPYSLKSDEVNKIATKYYPDSPAMQKVLSINKYTGIDTRSSIGTSDHPSVNKPEAPSIAELHRIFMSDGVPLAIEASRKAILEAGVDLSQITHIVSTTCTDSANPGFDHFVAKGLGITHQVEKVLLHGVGCAGGLAVLRTAANLALGHAMRRKPARILCVALEVSTTMVRSELNSIEELQETRIGACLFSDCASALVLSNGIGQLAAEPIYKLLGWEHKIIPGTEGDLGFDVDPVGWKVVLSPRVPKLATEILRPSFADLLENISGLPAECKEASDFDWAMHPGGLTILTGAETAMGISPEHMRASYDRYMNHGNSSSATIFSVMDRLRSKDMDALAPGGRVREYVVGCAFGPGIAIEMCMLKRNMRYRGTDIGPETDSEASRSEADEEADWVSIESRESIPGTPGSANIQAEPKPTLGEDMFVREAIASVELD